MAAKHKADGSPSLDEAVARGVADGRRIEHPDGSATVAVSPEMRAYIDLHAEMFEFKFGRKQGPDDFLFFDIYANKSQPVDETVNDIERIRAAAKETGVDPDAAVEHFLGREELENDLRRRRNH